jgi:GNAT superfamily N-acetyltransferase
MFETLRKDFARDDFDCGIERPNDFLRRYALQNLKKNISATMVAVSEKNTQKILGYCSVSMAQASFENLPADLAKSILRYYPVPAMRIGRLAVDRAAQGAGLGGELLRHTIYRALDLSREVRLCCLDRFRKTNSRPVMSTDRLLSVLSHRIEVLCTRA